MNNRQLPFCGCKLTEIPSHCLFSNFSIFTIFSHFNSISADISKNLSTQIKKVQMNRVDRTQRQRDRERTKRENKQMVISETRFKQKLNNCLASNNLHERLPFNCKMTQIN